MGTRNMTAKADGGLAFNEVGGDYEGEINEANCVAATTPFDDNPIKILATDTATPAVIPWATLKEQLIVGGLAPTWRELDEDDDWDDQPASTSTITMNSDWTGTIKPGMPVKFKLSDSYYYAIVTAITSNLLTIAGAPLTTGDGDLQELYIGPPERVVQVDLFVPGNYTDDVGDLLDAHADTAFQWGLGKAYLCAFSIYATAIDGGDPATVNVKINGSLVSTENSNNGPAHSSAKTWDANSAVAINTSNYDINRGEALDLRCTWTGMAPSAGEDLTASLLFVLE
jgi:hypothetical protein